MRYVEIVPRHSSFTAYYSQTHCRYLPSHYTKPIYFVFYTRWVIIPRILSWSLLQSTKPGYRVGPVIITVTFLQWAINFLEDDLLSVLFWQSIFTLFIEMVCRWVVSAHSQKDDDVACEYHPQNKLTLRVIVWISIILRVWELLQI